MTVATRDGIGTVSWLELAFILACAYGIARTLRGLVRWRREDRERARLGINGRVRVLYRGKVRLYFFCLVKTSLYMLLAIQAAFLPPYGTPVATMTPFQRRLSRLTHYSSPTLLTVSAILLLLIPLNEERDRQKMESADRKEWKNDVRREAEPP